MTLRKPVATLATALAFASIASGQEAVFEAASDNGFFTPFHSGNVNSVRYGDSGWIGDGTSTPVALGRITLKLATFNSTVAGSTDLVFTLNDGDPSGLVFGSGNPLYTVTIPGVTLPPATPGSAAFFSLDIPLPDVLTSGGFNNVGWSVRCQNWSYPGRFGFQVSSCNGQFIGFYTNNASFFNGSNWSLFSFGPDPCTQVANYSVTIYTSGCPADLDGDGSVGAADLATLLAAWDTGGKGLPEDLNDDGVVDAADLTLLLSRWGPCPPG